MKLSDNEKFESIKYLHESQANRLLKFTEVDLKIFITFLTFQIVFGGFLTQFELTLYGKIGLLLVDISASFVSVKLLMNNFYRRKEVVGIIKNCNIILGYETPDFYQKGIKVNVDTKFRPWFDYHHNNYSFHQLKLCTMYGDNS